MVSGFLGKLLLRVWSVVLLASRPGSEEKGDRGLVLLR